MPFATFECGLPAAVTSYVRNPAPRRGGVRILNMMIIEQSCFTEFCLRYGETCLP